MTEPYNVMNDNTGNRTDVRPQIIQGALNDFATRFEKDNWSLFEIFTLAIKLVEMVVVHARANKLAHPKRMTNDMDDGTRIEFTVRKRVDPMATLKNLQH